MKKELQITYSPGINCRGLERVANGLGFMGENRVGWVLEMIFDAVIEDPKALEGFWNSNKDKRSGEWFKDLGIPGLNFLRWCKESGEEGEESYGEGMRTYVLTSFINLTTKLIDMAIESGDGKDRITRSLVAARSEVMIDALRTVENEDGVWPERTYFSDWGNGKETQVFYEAFKHLLTADSEEVR